MVNSSIIQGEFIGLDVKVIASNNKNYVGISGRVIDETKNIFKILENNKIKNVVKNISIFYFKLPDSSIVQIDGKLLNRDPVNRLKNTIRRNW